MAFVYDLLLILHFLGLAAIIGGYLTVLRSPRIVVGMVHGALTQLVTGVAMVGLAQAALDEEVDNAKIGVKLLVALVVAVLAFANRRKEDVSPGVVHAVGGLAVLNVVVAVLW
ncbi:MAG: hypothetical protein ACLGIV_14905 [Actinomycetes bacterium]